MSVWENIELQGNFDLVQYHEIVDSEYGTQKHPSQPYAFPVDCLPYYAPIHSVDHISIREYKKITLPYSLLQALIDHPELVPDDALVYWTIEQELLLEVLIGELGIVARRCLDT